MPFIAIVYVTDHTAASRITRRYSSGDAGRIVGLFRFPSRSELKCSGLCIENGKSMWRRSPRGFMFCGVCGSRARKTRSMFLGSLFDRFGANMIEDAPAAFRTPEGYSMSSPEQ